jgi:hypothetical protein
MTFGSDGPLVQGTWVNPNTGDSFTVRDSFFEDNQYVVTTTDGRYIKYDQLQHYIQADKKAIEGIKQSIANKVKDEPLPTEIADLINDDYTDDSLITPEDYNLIYGSPNYGKTGREPISKSLGNLNDGIRHIAPAYAHATAPVATALPENMNTAIIKKALNNTEQPKFKVVVDWDNYPVKQIEMLYDIMGISEEEILEWYLDNMQMDDVITAIKNGIKNRICSTQKSEVVDVIIDKPVESISSISPVTIDECDAKPKSKTKKVTKSKK